MGSLRSSTFRAAAALFALTILAACEDRGDKFSEQYAMLEETGASQERMCALANEAADWAFDEGEREAFKRWTETANEACTGRTLPPETTGPATGTITGDYSYPSDYIPDDINACASNVETNEMHCDSRRNGDEFSLVVPPGKYRIWAETSDWPGYRAYFSEAVRCGLSVGCDDHSPVVINLEPGETINGVNPHDWYAGN